MNSRDDIQGSNKSAATRVLIWSSEPTFREHPYQSPGNTKRLAAIATATIYYKPSSYWTYKPTWLTMRHHPVDMMTTLIDDKP